ncbi:hypothetical protein [Kitasatospora sp. NPDC098663]|uniref:hypothetical protein n=1 Tax=Kitasatospora sp. NPDC098663 TaxID=3364096 RepID=UPI00382052B2
MTTRRPHLVAAVSGLLRRTHPPALPPRDVQLARLLAILDEAVAAQGESDRIVAACGASGAVSGSVGRSGGVQLNIYQRLGTRLVHLDVDDTLAPYHEHAMRLIAYHRWILHEAMNLAFTPHPDPRAEAMRSRLAGLGRPAADLRTLRHDLHTLASRTTTPAAPR